MLPRHKRNSRSSSRRRSWSANSSCQLWAGFSIIMQRIQVHQSTTDTKTMPRPQRPPHSLLCAGAAWLFSSRRMTLLEAVRGRLATATTLCTLNNGLRACLMAA